MDRKKSYSFVQLALFLGSIIHLPINLPLDFPNSEILYLSKSYDKKVKRFYLIAVILLMLCISLTVIFYPPARYSN